MNEVIILDNNYVAVEVPSGSQKPEIECGQLFYECNRDSIPMLGTREFNFNTYHVVGLLTKLLEDRKDPYKWFAENVLTLRNEVDFIILKKKSSVKV